MKWDSNTVENGMLVTSTSGERIGKIIRADDEETFVVEKGTFFPKDYQLRYDHITGVNDDGTLIYSLAESLEREPLTAREPEREPLASRAADSGRRGAAAVTAAGASALGAVKAAATPGARSRQSAPQVQSAPQGERTTEPASLRGAEAWSRGDTEPRARGDAEARSREQEVRIPLLKEELDVETFAYESGRVKIHKIVNVEDRHFTVPVRREELVVEHLPPKDRSTPASMDATAANEAFQDRTMDIPLYEEDIRVGKHPVLREEVVVRTVAHFVDVEGSASLRSEEADVQDTRRAPADTHIGQPGGYSASGEDTDIDRGRGAQGREGYAPEGYGAPARR